MSLEEMASLSVFRAVGSRAEVAFRAPVKRCLLWTGSVKLDPEKDGAIRTIAEVRRQIWILFNSKK